MAMNAETQAVYAKYGVSAELIDGRSLVPFNYDIVLESVKKTGKI